MDMVGMIADVFNTLFLKNCHQRQIVLLDIYCVRNIGGLWEN